MKILIVVDMQNDFIDGSLGSPEAKSIVSKVVEKINQYKEQNNIIYYTLDTHNEYYDKTLEGRKLPIAHCIYGTNGYNLNNQVKEALGDNIENKACKVTFGSVDLIRYLSINMYKKYDIDEVELVGLCTDICVVSNALLARAYFPNMPITVDASCCAGTTIKKHKAALEVMKSCQIDIINE